MCSLEIASYIIFFISALNGIELLSHIQSQTTKISNTVLSVLVLMMLGVIWVLNMASDCPLYLVNWGALLFSVLLCLNIYNLCIYYSVSIEKQTDAAEA